MLLGCDGQRNPATYPVQGVVRFEDGTLLRDGTVEFESTSAENPPTARGKIGPDGMFRLGTFDRDDGALPGEHRVIVLSYHTIGGGAERPGLIPEVKLATKYSNYRTSDLRQIVEEGGNNVVIEVQSAEAMESDKEASTE